MLKINIKSTMNNITKKLVFALLIVLLICLYLSQSFAVTSKNTTNTKQEDDEKIVLNSLEIEGLSLEPSFNADIHQYTVETNESIKNMKINANASEDDAIIKIIGNTNLIKGQNVVTIIVSDLKENNISTYQIYVNNNMVKPETIEEHYKDASIQQEIKKWITIILVIVIIICLLVIKKLFSLKREIKYKEKNKQIYEQTINEIINKNYLSINKKIQIEQERAKKRNNNAKRGKHSK